MSAAATAAGYLYASGRLRGRGAKGEDPERPENKKENKPEERGRAQRREVRVAVYPADDRPRRAPKIQYRTRRWKPDEPRNE